MKRSSAALIFGALLLVAMAGWFAINQSPDPVHAGRRASEWLWDLDSDDPVRSQQSTNAFVAMGTNALPFLKATLDRSDSFARRALMDLQERFPVLHFDLYANSARTWRCLALDAAPALGTNAAPILSELAEAVGDFGAFSHVEFLASFKLLALRPVLAALTNASSAYGSRALLESLRLILDGKMISGVDEELAIAALHTALKENWDEFVDREAAYAIGRFGSKAERAIPVLLDCLTNRLSKSSYPAAWALGRINRQPERVLPALVRATDKNRFCAVRAEAARAIGDFGTNAAGLIPLLVRLSADRDSEVREGAVHALVKIDPEARQTITALKRQLRDRNAYLRRRAVEFSETVKGHSAKLAGPIRKLLQDKDDQVRCAAIAWLSTRDEP